MSQLPDSALTGLYTLNWYLTRNDIAGAQRVLRGMLHPNTPTTPEPSAPAPGISFGELIATAAESEIGVREVGNNGGATVRLFQSTTWLKPGAWPWCAAFVCHCVREAAGQYQNSGGTLRFTLPRTPGARDLYNWAKDIDNDTGKYRKRSGGIHAGVRTIDLRRERMRRGDIIIYDTFSHCGIVRHDETQAGFDGREELETIEGNTNKAGAREGDGVYAKHRSARRGGERVRHAIRVTT